MPSVTDAHHHEAAAGMQFAVLGALSVAHLLNDMMQSLLLAMYPMLKGEFTLSFAQWA
jgi:FSR family fosmidomycin resistance protein-like MFS transporter